MIISAARVLAARTVLAPGWIEVGDDRILTVGHGAPPRPPDRHTEGWLAPGFVDIHAHGGAGGDFADATPAAVAAATGHHLAHGTTTMVASLVTAPLDDLARAVAVLAEHVADGVLAGVHLEGPFLSAAHCGAHRPELLCDPEPRALARLLDAGRGAVRMVTLAPELTGGIDAVRRITGHGAVAAVGHTAADYETTAAAVEAGARIATHLGNGMPSPHHRRPGPVAALLERDDVTVELIVDGQHLHPATVRTTRRTTGPDRIALISDAVPAAGLPDGRHMLGGAPVEIVAGVVRLTGESRSLAGSTLTLDRAVRGAVAAGMTVPDALRAATAVPAAALGLDGAGVLRPGARADAVLLDADLHVLGALHSGRWGASARIDPTETHPRTSDPGGATVAP